ncbi:MAG: cupin domain-containing protein [Deltaproteobacteria bacterium]|nr:cupin domain-containing protein [Deltaproteobacteria bacterium]
MKVQNYLDVKEEKVKDEGARNTTIRWVISKEDGAPNFAMRVFDIGPGGNTPFHQHLWEHEVFVLEGMGKIKGEKEEVPIKSGDTIFVEPNEKHQFINTGTGSLKIICVIPHHE